MIVTVLLPTFYRPNGIKRTLDSLFSSITLDKKIQVKAVIAREIDDRKVEDIVSEYNFSKCAVCPRPEQGPAYAWNVALFHARNSDLYFLGSDDIVFHPGWLIEALREFEKLNYSGVVGCNDMSGKYERAGFSTQLLMSRDYMVEYNGGVAAYPFYYADYVDLEICVRAKAVNKFVYAKDSIVEHRWREVMDRGYEKVTPNILQSMGKLYHQREHEGFPNDFERIIK